MCSFIFSACQGICIIVSKFSLDMFDTKSFDLPLVDPLG